MGKKIGMISRADLVRLLAADPSGMLLDEGAEFLGYVKSPAESTGIPTAQRDPSVTSVTDEKMKNECLSG